MEIPILNIYYLLCYAWDRLEEGEKVKVSVSDYNDALNLFTRVLLNGIIHLFKRGLDKSYNPIIEEYSGIKGKIDFNASLNKQLFKQAKAICEFDEFGINTIQNQIIKATLYRIARVKALDKKLKNEVWSWYWKFQDVDDIELQISHFSRVKINKNNSFYSFLLHICRLIHESTVLDEKDGKYFFKEFIRSEKVMASLFEAFIRNFYKKEVKTTYYKIGREDIYWNAIPVGISNVDLLPKMQTDVTLESTTRKIIIETKYYTETLSYNYSTEKFHSHNLYQLYAYLRNTEVDSDIKKEKECEGILLYPTVKDEYDELYLISGHKLRIATINLASEWKQIHSRLLELIL